MMEWLEILLGVYAGGVLGMGLFAGWAGGDFGARTLAIMILWPLSLPVLIGAALGVEQ